MPIDEYKSGQGIYLDKIIDNIDTKNINAINLSNHMQGDKLYYKTDHHMNMNGAFKAYEKIIKNDLSVAIIGDSMDNPLISLIAQHFKNTYSYDLGHYKDDIISEIKNINPDVILMIGASSNYVNRTEIFNWKREDYTI